MFNIVQKMAATAAFTCSTCYNVHVLHKTSLDA